MIVKFKYSQIFDVFFLDVSENSRFVGIY